MLSKLLKYDFRALSKYGKPMLFVELGIIVLGMLDAWLIGSLIVHTSTQIEADSVSMVLLLFAFLMELVVIFALFGMLVAILVLSLVHFYKSLVTDEGYLTFTLPVKASEILLSKVINGFIWQLIFGALAVGGVIAIVTFGVGMSVFLPASQTDLFFEITQELTSGSVYVLREILGLESLYNGVVWILNVLVGMIYGQLLYYTVIFFASVVAKKNKVLASIGLIIGAYFVNGIISSIVSLFSDLFGLAFSGGIVSYFGFSLTVTTAFYAGMSVVLFFLTKYMMEKKLNLP